jgi:hypothetical protein
MVARAIAISAGHGKYIRGASASPQPPYLDEVDEARRVVQRVYDMLMDAGVKVVKFWDDTSTSQNQNLNTIVNWHNKQSRDLDVSVHFNAYQITSKPMGTEVLYVTQSSLASDLSGKLASAQGLPNRGGKYRSDLAFLNGTNKPAILIEVCFVDSSADGTAYRAKFEEACNVIASVISGVQVGPGPSPGPEPEPEPTPPPASDNRVDVVSTIEGDVSVYINGVLTHGHEGCEHVVRTTVSMTGDVSLVINGEEFHNQPAPEEALLHVSGKCSWFGGPNDTGVSPSEGLAFIYNYNDRPDLFLPQQPSGTTGLARRLNPDVYYIACRWDYNVTSKSMLASKSQQARVRANGREFLAWPADWGPNENTGRVADLSKGLLDALGITTDDQVEVSYPASPAVA